MNTNSDAAQWRDLGLSDDLLSLIEKAGFKSPTPIQTKAIPLALKGDDLIASAQTGSGKTACFCFPMIEKMVGRKGTFGLILSPTREIALQTQQTLEQFAAPLGIRSVSLIGGVNLRSDEERLKAGPHILVGTPGRICDHLERGNLWLEYIEMLVLDEADRMLDMGFAKELSRITSEISEARQTLLFSATIPQEIERLANRILRKPTRVQVGRALSTNTNVEQRALLVNERQKVRELMHLLQDEKETVIVFNRTKDNTFKLWRASLDYGMEDSTYISSNKRQNDREKALEGFKDGTFRILFATDVAGRGIHVENVGHVINYDLPEEPEDYIHRIGRTGRKGATGRATSFVTPREVGQLQRIERVLGSKIPSDEAHGFSREASSRAPARAGRSSGSRGGSRSGRSSSARSPRSSSPRGGSRDSARSTRSSSPREGSRDERPSRSRDGARGTRSSSPRASSRDDRPSRSRDGARSARSSSPRDGSRDERPSRSRDSARSARSSSPREGSRDERPSRSRDGARSTRSRSPRAESRDGTRSPRSRSPRTETREERPSRSRDGAHSTRSRSPRTGFGDEPPARSPDAVRPRPNGERVRSRSSARGSSTKRRGGSKPRGR